MVNKPQQNQEQRNLIMADTIGFVGIGNMGAPMATRLLEAGHELVVFDAYDDALSGFATKGAVAASSPSDVADKADVVLISLPTPEIVREVVLGKSGLAAGSRCRTIIDLSTTGPHTASEVGAALQARGKIWMDAPVSGGVGGAKAGTLAVMVSGPRSEYDHLLPLLHVIGKVFFVSEIAGQGQTMKIVNNLLSGAALVLTAEALAMGVKAGLKAETMIDVINASSGRNSATADKFPKAVLNGDFNYGFSTKLMFKDINLFIEKAEEMGLSLRTAAAIRQLWFETLNEIGDKDFTTVAQLVERRAGVEIRQSAEAAE
ncbi:NAD(P)-dependent oxidoreductase (plasmid) [Marinobacter sp. M3C]|nr:NAD(P)-dependent oxidoreductase [Marinobacter sp. M3C]UQG62755.1 NAD(P)-dependent oxidoreductase [Marinobacter sp. M3C]